MAKKFILWGLLAGAVYMLLSYHYVYMGKGFKLLKKSEFTLNYTFFSTVAKTNSTILAVDELREDGIADLLVNAGRMTEEEKDRILSKYNYNGR